MAAQRVIITLECNDCRERNYSTTKNKRANAGEARALEVLLALPEAHEPQGNEVGNQAEDQAGTKQGTRNI